MEEQTGLDNGAPLSVPPVPPNFSSEFSSDTGPKHHNHRTENLYIYSSDSHPKSSQSHPFPRTELPHLPGLDSSDVEFKEKGNLSDIIKICDKHVCDQTNSVQSILNICSQITGFSGCEKFCSQIISFCNQILTGTYQNTHSIIGICHGLSSLSIYNNIKSSQTKKGKSLLHSKLSKEKEECKVVNDVKQEDLQEKLETDNCNVVSDIDVMDSFESDSDEFINQDDDPDWSAHWSKKRTITFKKLKKNEEPVLSSNEADEQSGEEEIKHTEKDSDWQPETDEETEKDTKPKKKKTAKTKPLPPRKKGPRKKKSIKEETPGEFPCNFCRKICKTKEAHEKHQALHQCDICGLVMLSPGTIYDHKRSHSGEKPFICDICGASFSTNPILKKHKINIHTEGRPFPCDQCEYGAKSLELLRRHQLVHSGERKYQCDDCGACFPRSATLKEHVLTHKDIWPHHCQFCPKRFKNIRQLRRHEEIHLDQYKYQCKVCGKRMRQVGNLNTHMRTHNGEKPYVCDKCGKRFAHNVTRKQHMESCFGNMEVIAPPPSLLPLPLPVGLQFSGSGLNRGGSSDTRF